MSQYNVTLYKNTGFNSINIPDSPTLLAGMSSISVPALDINQERFLPNIRVRASWNDIKDADYAKVGDFFYTINDIQMTSGDVADISLTPDYITSAGGPGSLTILDGLTNRVHVADDTFGLYNGDDPYMNPAYDMDVVTSIHQFSSTYRTFVETTLNLYQLGEKYEDGELEAYTAIDTITPVDPDDPDAKSPSVTVPIAEYLVTDTTYQASFFGSNITLQKVKNQGVFEIGTEPLVTKGINVARSLGIEQSISGQYCIPSDLITAGPADSSFKASMTGAGDIIGGWAASLAYEYGTAQNKRVFYGNQSKYTLISSTGESISANAEEVYEAGTTAPRVRYIVDPRRTGKPFFRFAALNGNTERYDFFRGSIAGTPWDSVPMVFTQKSGSLLDRVNYNASLARRNLSDEWEGATYTLNKAGEYTQMAVDTTAGYLKGGVGGGVSAGLKHMNSLANIEASHMQYRDQSDLERAIERKQFGISQTVNVPTVMFPADPTLCNEYLHNGVILCRNIYKAADIARIDKILTAFGYKHTKVLEASDFTNRQYFNYVEGSISVGGNLPRWWATGIAAQINGGVRVWHVKPSHTYYTNNPIRVTP